MCRLSTPDANAGKWFIPARPLARPTAIDFIGSCGYKGNGQYREELRKALAALTRYLTAHQLPQARALVRLEQYGLGAVLADLAGFAIVTRGKEYHVLDHALVQARLHLPADQSQQRLESQMVRSLYDCPQIPVGPEGVSCRVVVATHLAEQSRKKKKKKTVGVTHAGVVYELFFTNLPQQAIYLSNDNDHFILLAALYGPCAARAEADPNLMASSTNRCARGSAAHGLRSERVGQTTS